MKTLLYLVQLAVAIPLSVFAFIFAPVICLFMDKATGLLPYPLHWFQPPDTDYNGIKGGCYDALWIATHPTWSLYKCAWTFIQRNPAYGYNYYVRSPVTSETKVTVEGNLLIDDVKGIAGYYKITTEDGYFEYREITDLGNGRCMIKEYGWNLTPLAKGYTSPVLGSLLVVLYARFSNFGTEGN
jgi:hypothetical protein